MKVLCYTITRWRKRNAAYTKGWKRSMSEKVVMLGNEAIARGSHMRRGERYRQHIQVHLSTPEISENLVKYKDESLLRMVSE